MNACVAELFDDACAKAVAEDVVFESADDLHLPGETRDAVHVERFDPARIDEGDGEAFGFEFFLGGFGDGEHVAQANEGHVVAVGNDFGLADFEADGLVLGHDARAVATRVADGDWAAFIAGHGPEHVHELVFIARLHVDDAGDATEVGDVEEAMVRGAVITAEAATVHAQAHGQVLDGHVMHDHVERALHEGGVDGEEGLQATGGEAAGKQRSMLFGDAHIEIAFGDFLFEDAQTGTARHGSSDGDDFLVFLGEVGDAAGEDLRVGRFVAGGGFAGFAVVFPEAVEFAGIVEGRGVAAAFFGDDVQDHRLFLRLEELKGLNEQRDVVPVDGAVVADAEFVEERAAIGWRLTLRQQDVFGVVFDLLNDAARVFAEHELEQLASFLMQVGVSGMRGDGIEVLRDGTNVAVDGPLVVVEHDDEALSVRGDVVHRFKHGAAGEGGVAGHADDVFISAHEIAAGGHAQGGGEGGASVACAVAVVFAFGAEEEAVQAVVLANGMNAVPAAREHFVDVALVRDIEDKAVLGRVKHPM